MPSLRLVLASASPRRRELLQRWDIPHQVVVPDVEEILHAADPDELVTINARLKAEKVLETDPGRVLDTGLQFGLATDPERPPDETADSGRRSPHVRNLVLGVDTVVVVDDHVLGKPGSSHEAREMLERLSGRAHEVRSGIHVAWHDRPEEGRSAVGKTRVWFRRLRDEEIEWYVQSGEGADKAGAYGIQDRGGQLVERIEGCYFNVVGFPIATFITVLAGMGITLEGLRTGRGS